MRTTSITAGLGAVLGLAGCATPPSGEGGGIMAAEPAPAAARVGVVYRDFEYGWRDAGFYRDWYDQAAFVLPPPPPGAMTSHAVKAGRPQADAAQLREVDFDGAAAAGK